MGQIHRAGGTACLLAQFIEGPRTKTLMQSGEVAWWERILMQHHRSAGLRPGAFARARTRNAGSETGAPPFGVPVGGSVKMRPVMGRGAVWA